MRSLTATVAGLVIILAITVVTLLLIGYCVIRGIDVPAVVMTLLGVVLGFLGAHVSSAQGAEQALQTQANTVTLPLSALASAPSQPRTAPTIVPGPMSGPVAPPNDPAPAPSTAI